MLIAIIVAVVVSILVSFVVTSTGWIRYHKRVFLQLIEEKHDEAAKSFSRGWDAGLNWTFGMDNDDFARQRIVYHSKKAA